MSLNNSNLDAMNPTWILDEQISFDGSPRNSIENKDPNTYQQKFSPKPPNSFDSVRKPSYSSIRKSMRIGHDVNSPTQDFSFSSPIQNNNISMMSDDSLMKSDSKKSNLSQRVSAFSFSPLEVNPSSFPRRKITLQSVENDLCQEVERLRSQVHSQQESLQTSQKTICELTQKIEEIEAARMMSLEDCQSKDFWVSLQAQKITELENKINMQKMDFHESLSKRSRKHNHAMKKLQQEKAQFEEQANVMMQQMAEQMNQLQSTAMQRIAVSKLQNILQLLIKCCLIGFICLF